MVHRFVEGNKKKMMGLWLGTGISLTLTAEIESKEKGTNCRDILRLCYSIGYREIVWEIGAVIRVENCVRVHDIKITMKQLLEICRKHMLKS